MNLLATWAARWSIPDQAVRELAQLYRTAPGEADGSEARVQADLRIFAPTIDAALWRNNRGAMVDNTGRTVRYGLGNDSKRLSDVWKSSDLIGILPVLILPQHVGKRAGIFMAVEVKEPGWRGPKGDHEKAQAEFLNTVEAMGGIGLFASSVDDLRRRVGR